LVSLANQAAAFDRISRSRRSCLFSRRRRANSSRSRVVRPSFLFPSSRSACLTQLWMACAEGSNSRESSSGFHPPRTNSTIRRRNSGGYGGRDFGMTDTSLDPQYCPIRCLQNQGKSNYPIKAIFTIPVTGDGNGMRNRTV
jgi:hypothetical protein